MHDCQACVLHELRVGITETVWAKGSFAGDAGVGLFDALIVFQENQTVGR